MIALVKIHRLSVLAQLPKYQTPGAAACDLHFASAEGVTLAPGETRVFPTGLALAIPQGYEAQIRPRSSLSRKGIICAFGTIDSDYRGEIMAGMTNLSGAPYPVWPGDRIAQLVIAPVLQVAWQEVATADDLGTTERGLNGFGSTGR